MPDLPQIGIGLAQRSQQIVRRLIEADIRVLGLVGVDHHAVGDGVL